MPDPDTTTPAALRQTRFLDSDTPALRLFAEKTAGQGTERERAVRLYQAIRDGIRYDPYSFRVTPDIYIASNCLTANSAFCVPKAILLSAAARSVGIPARVGFANVRNHLSSPKLTAMMGSDLFRWHGYSLLCIDGKWVKATPAFDLSLCERFGVHPLDFDGTEDSIYHPFDMAGRRHMEYVDEIGVFDDFPFETFADDMRQSYPAMLRKLDELDHAGTGMSDTAFAPDKGPY